MVKINKYLILTFFIFLFFAVNKIYSRCLGTEFNLRFLIEAKNIYLVKVIEVSTKGKNIIYKVITLKNFKGKNQNEFLIYTNNNNVEWSEDSGAELLKNSTYIIEPYIDNKNIARLGGCSYILSNTDKSFKHDSTCFASFYGDNIYVNNKYYSGLLVNGQPHGNWREYEDSGKYNHGVRVKNWIIDSKPVIYKRGRKYIYEETWFGDTVVMHKGRTAKMICKDRILRTRKWHKSNLFGEKIKIYANGFLIQYAIFNKWNGLKKIKCYKNGKLIYSNKFKLNDEDKRAKFNFDPDPSDYFYSFEIFPLPYIRK